MKIQTVVFQRLWRCAILALSLLLTNQVFAGLTLEMNVVRYHQYGYYFFPNLTTNSTGPVLPFGDYWVTSSGYPANGAWQSYHFDTNGFNFSGGGNNGYSDFDSMKQQLTNGLWSISVTNTATTNVFFFRVTANISSNDLPYVNITFPTDGSVNVTNVPTFTWQGPTNYNNLVVYEFNDSATLPVTQTSWVSAHVLYQGPNSVTVHYDSNSVTAVVSSAPTNSAGQLLTSSWVSTAHLQDYSTSQFTVGAVDASGTGHTLIAHYTWNGTNNDGSASGVDSSGNGYNMNFSGSFGSQGGQSSTTDAQVGSRAIQFHDGDGNSGGFAGWNPTPTNLLNALAGSFSISCWIKTSQSYAWDDAPAYYGAGIISAENSGLANDLIPMALTGGKIGFNTGGSEEDVTLHSAAYVNDDTFHHVVVTRNQATGQKIIYIDGMLDIFGSGTTNLLNDPQLLTIGALSDAWESDASSAGYFNGFDGIIDDLQIYSGVLSSNEVAQLFSNPGNTANDVTDFSTALNTTGLTWNSGGDLPWFVENTTTHDNNLAVQSGAIDDNQESWIETTVTGPGTLSFWWRVSSDDGADYVEFLIDDEWQTDITGDSGWVQQNFNITSGTYTLRWRYYKDSCCTDGLDAAFLDEVNFTPAVSYPGPIITLNPFDQTNYPGYNVALLAASTSNAAIDWQWYKTGSGLILNATNALFIPSNSGSAGVAGSYFAIASNLFGSATTTVATVTFQTAPLPPDWSRAFTTQLYGNGTDPSTNINLACLIDSTGTNIYTAGSLIGTNTFGSDVLAGVNNREISTFLKQTATGTPIWGRCITNFGDSSSFPRGIAVAPGDGFYVTGFFSGTNGIGTNRFVETAGGSTYLIRFDSIGNVLWTRSIVGTNFNFPTHHTIVSDAAGSVTLSVLISGYTSFGGTNIFADGQKGVLVQYDVNGNVRWIQTPSSWPDYLVHNSGRIYGCMGGSSTNFIGGVTNNSSLRRQLFALNTTNGQAIWLQGFLCSQDQPDAGLFGDNNATIAISGTNLFVIGSSFGTNNTFGSLTVDFPNGVGQYFARYDTNGNAQVATTFGSRYVWPWAALADTSGNVYLGADFDTYAAFGTKIIAAQFHETVQFINNDVENRLPGQTCIAKFDRDGNSLWARLASSPTSYANTRDIALAGDGVWSCGFFNPSATFGVYNISGVSICVGSPFCLLTPQRSGFLAKVTESANFVTLLNLQILSPANNIQFSFQSQSGFTHTVESKTNLITDSWHTRSNLSGDGTLKTVQFPTTNQPAEFFRVKTQ